MSRYLMIIVIAVLFFQCEDQYLDSDLDLGYEYLPVSLDDYRIYEMTEINFNAQGGDTLHYFLKEQLVDTLQSGENLTYLLARSTRMADTLEWEIADIWTLRKDETKVVLTEENIPYVKLTFPAEINKTWNGHAFNDLGEMEYRYEKVDESFDPDLLPGLIKVVIADISKNLVNQDERSEIYCKGIGLIEKNYTTLSFCTSDCSSQEINSGRILEQALIAYGKN